ncbi:D-alanyl-D-alanine carboxypeptidase [Streptomyces sp. NPDC001381]|uniref:D-alanyl-D-alanine carboxypeptidase family protein n=1 Tax=Streptomyces sp. NPDC001381 TaxID=3364567 RepID=UPI003696DACA
MHAFTRPSRRSLLAFGALAPLAAATPAAAATGTVIGGARLARDGVQATLTTGLPKKLTARAWLLADYDTGEVLASYRAHRRLAPASTLKMLFADTLLGKFERTERYTVTDADLAGLPPGSSLVGLEPGVTYTVEQLWQGVFLRSGNDAVHILALMNGGVAKSVADMRAKAADLQALDTHVVSCDGYDHTGQLSSAYDLTLFARHGLRNADFRAYCSTKAADFPAGGRRTFRIENTDRLLSGTYGVTPYDGMIGVKNGYTTHAGNTFTGAATRDGRTLLVTVLHPESGNNAVYEETAALLDWGFGKGGSAGSVGRLVDPLSEGGASASPSGRTPHAGAQAAEDGGSGGGWGVFGGAGGAILLLAAGAYEARRRRRAEGAPGTARRTTTDPRPATHETPHAATHETPHAATHETPHPATQETPQATTRETPDPAPRETPDPEPGSPR